MSFIFGGNTGITYADLMRERERNKALRTYADKMAGGIGSPSTFGQGLSALGKGLAARSARNDAKAEQERLDGLETQGQGRATSVFQDLFKQLYGGQGASSAMPSRNAALAANGGPTNAAAAANGGGSGLPAPQRGELDFTPGDRESFIKAMLPHATRVSQETGLDPRLVIAQAAQETGWGKSAPNNNFFGIKSHGTPGGATLSTREVINGQSVNVND